MVSGPELQSFWPLGDMNKVACYGGLQSSKPAFLLNTLSIAAAAMSSAAPAAVPVPVPTKAQRG